MSTAAHGSGAVSSKSRNKTILNVGYRRRYDQIDLFATASCWPVLPLAVGSRLLVDEPGKGLTRIEQPALVNCGGAWNSSRRGMAA